MTITKEFINTEIAHLTKQLEKSRTDVIAFDSVIAAFKFLLTALDSPEPEKVEMTEKEFNENVKVGKGPKPKKLKAV